jgi:hypothetical protein
MDAITAKRSVMSGQTYMNWLWFIIVIAIIGGVIGFFSSDGNKDDAVTGAVVGGWIAGQFVIYILGTLLFFYIVLKIGGCLFN